MTNWLKNNLTTRKGFIIGVVLLVLVNYLVIGVYYKIRINNEVNQNYIKIVENLDEDLKEIKKSKNKNIEKTIADISKQEKLKITIYDTNNEIVKEYNNLKKHGSNITTSGIIEINQQNYLVKITKKDSVLKDNIFIEFYIFELALIIILCLIGIHLANVKILDPLAFLNKDFSNYKLGILPNKRKITSAIDNLQNDFVDLVGELEEEKKNQTRIIASISHDIKTPLTSLLGYTELLKQSEKDNKYVNTIYTKAINIKEIVEDFDEYLNYHLRDSHKLENITIKHLIEYLNDYYKEELKEKNIDLKIHTNCSSLYINVDLSKFKRVFSNIITNSIRFYGKNTKNILIINITSQKNGKIKFEIKDNAKGCKEDLNKIFEPLYTTDKGRKISGLGLSICSEIIKEHHGTIYAENNNIGGLSIIFIIDEYKE